MATTTAIVLSGVALGIVSAIMPLGPVTVLVLRRALSGDSSGALLVGLGRVPAEMFYCALATFGIVAVLDRLPAVRAGIELLGTMVLLAVGVWLLVPRAKPTAASTDPPTAAELRSRRWGDAAGFIISILNPTLLLSWSAIVAVAVSVADLEPTLFDKVAFPLALGLGLALGYVMLVEFLRRHGARVPRARVQLAIRATGGLLVALALWNLLVLLGRR